MADEDQETKTWTIRPRPDTRRRMREHLERKPHQSRTEVIDRAVRRYLDEEERGSSD